MHDMSRSMKVCECGSESSGRNQCDIFDDPNSTLYHGADSAQVHVDGSMKFAILTEVKKSAVNFVADLKI